MAGFRRIFSKDFLYLGVLKAERRLDDLAHDLSRRVSDENRIRLWGAAAIWYGITTVHSISSGDALGTAWNFAFGLYWSHSFARDSLKVLRRK